VTAMKRRIMGGWYT